MFYRAIVTIFFGLTFASIVSFLLFFIIAALFGWAYCDCLITGYVNRACECRTLVSQIAAQLHFLWNLLHRIW